MYRSAACRAAPHRSCTRSAARAARQARRRPAAAKATTMSGRHEGNLFVLLLRVFVSSWLRLFSSFEARQIRGHVVHVGVGPFAQLIEVRAKRIGDDDLRRIAVAQPG